MAEDKTTLDNRTYFDELAPRYDGRFGRTLDQLMERIRDEADFIGVDWKDYDEDSNDEEEQSVRLLDYACGTGLVSQALAPLTTQCIGIDISSAMVNVYNHTATNQGLTQDDMFAVVGNLLHPSEPSPTSLKDSQFFNFDIAAVGLGAHHFDDPALAARQLVHRLKPGGVLVFIDFLQHEPVATGTKGLESVRHYGFSKNEVKRFFEEGGAGEGFELKVMGKALRFQGHGAGPEGVDREVFIARGEKEKGNRIKKGLNLFSLYI